MADEWKGYEMVIEDKMLLPVDTTYAIEELAKLAEVITTLPKDKKFIRKIERYS